MRKAFICGGLIAIVFFGLIGLYQGFMSWRYSSIQSFVDSKESDRTYDKDLLYLLPWGEPIVWVKPGNARTLFFVEGFRGQAGAGIYREWFKELHEKHGVNIIAPVIGLQGWPFRQRNKEWHHQEDMREALQIYDAYTANLPKGHRIIMGSQSFGTLANLVINARARRKPDASVLVSPLNTRLVYGSGGFLVRFIASQMSWLQLILPFMKRGRNPKRASEWDIVNDRKNIQISDKIAKHVINWEENVRHGVQVKQVAHYMENDLIPQVKGKKFVMVFGDSDLYFPPEGFRGLAEKLRNAGNQVEDICFKKTGHMVLFDNGGETAKRIIIQLLDAAYPVKNQSRKDVN